MSTIGPADRGDLRHIEARDLFERIFTTSSQSAEQFRELEETAILFSAVGLYGRPLDDLRRNALSAAFSEVFFCAALPEVTLLLVRAGADCEDTAGRAAAWLREHDAARNVAYLPGEHCLQEARRIRDLFEKAAPEMFFLRETACLPLDSLGPARTDWELDGEDLRRLRQLRRDLCACLVRGEAGYVRERLEEYFAISARGGPAQFREQCAALYFRLGEELAAPDEKQDAYRRGLYRSEKTVFRLMERSNSASEIISHLSWYTDQLLAWYCPLRQDTSCRVAALVEEYIEKHYMEPVSVEDIAAKAGLSANYVRSIFKSSRGKTIQRYLSEYRLETACQLLRSTSITVSKVGRMVGYNNVSYFCASFQKCYGKTPSEWRRTL